MPAKSAKPRTTPRRSTKKAAQSAATNRMWSVVLTGLGVLLMAMTFIQGASIWNWLRVKVLFGLFGLGAYLVGPALLYVAFLIAAEKPFKHKILEMLALLTLLCGAIQIFTVGQVAGTGALEQLKGLYAAGTNELGGGALAAVIGWPLLSFFGRPAADLTVVVLTVVFFMLLISVTPADIFSGVKRRAGEAGAAIKDSVRISQEEATVAREEKQLRYKAKQQELKPAPTPLLSITRRQGAIDISLGPNAGARKAAAEPQIVAEQSAPIESAALPLPEAASRFTRKITIPGTPEENKRTLLRKPAPAFSIDALAEAAAVEEPPHDTEGEPPLIPDILSGKKPAPALVDPKQELADKIQAIALATAAQEMPEQPPKDLAEQAQTAEKEIKKPEGTKPEREAPRKKPYIKPSINLFDKARPRGSATDEYELRHSAETLVNTLQSFGVSTRILNISRGPSVTRFELQPQAGVKISRITNLADDIALALATAGVRIEAPIPNKAAVGIEVPNKHGSSVPIRSILDTPEYEGMASPLTLPLGKDIAGAVRVADLARMPHLLIAGATGSGKSVCINAIIISLLYKTTPDEVKLILIDPKVVELAEYNGIPHLLMPVVTEPRKAAGALGTAVGEMEKRYRMFAENNVRDMKSYNRLAESRAEQGDENAMEKLPYIVVIIDELADLMMVAGKDVEDYICRLAQKARAAGIHLIVATQRPSVDVITGLIKANIPSRLAFAVASQIDSRVILDSGGAEKLLGMGDMLFMPVGENKPIRIQGAYVTDGEIEAVTKAVKKNATADYDEEMIEEMEKLTTGERSLGGEDGEEQDPMLQKAIELVVEAGQASTSMLQRRLKLGYGRASRLVDEMEQMHIVSAQDGSKPRQVLMNRQQWIEMSMNSEESSSS